MIDDEFYPPPECPVFEPTEEEFADPLGYINKIRPIAEKAGICKIRPPPHWQPPFAIDVENFKFTPRVQRINELGIHTRIRLQFIESIAKFWDLQGTAFKLPHVCGKALDLYGLHDTVKKLGGFVEVSKNKQWNHVCQKLGLQKNFGTVLRQHYERILYPFDIMKSGVLLEALESDEKRADITSQLTYSQMKSKKKTMYKGSGVSLENLDLFNVPNPTPELLAKQRNKRRPVDEPLVVDVSKNKELARLQLFGSAGPKMVGLGLTAQGKHHFQDYGDEAPAVETPVDEKPAAPNGNVKVEPEDKDKPNPQVGAVKQEPGVAMETKPEIKPVVKSEMRRKIRTRNKGSDQIPYSIIDTMDNCKICGKDNHDSLLLLCDGCDDSYHTYCLIPPLPNVPTGDWRCPKCIAKECNKKAQAYGFEQARKQYSLQSFGEMADAFKSEYFNKPVHMVPTEVVEREFWRLVGSLEEDLTVEYGADIHVVEHGSGFPRMCDASNRSLSSEEEEYAKSPWNLNNLPVQEQSLLRSVSGDISGMKIPWVYVGMCFSAFCWHIEDHWTYSINYMHWGEPKTWYGIPREDADKFEKVMEESAPELFKNYPDILHHLVTTMNPTTLMKNGVRVVRTNQCAGEFMVTFPRAYHAGFNQGYNFAEAVNFCPADWVPVGRMCIEHYRKMRKCCVFSHEEIVCKVAHHPENLDVQVAAVIYRDMLAMLQNEKDLRKKLMDLGVSKSEREAFELVPDDERQCTHCSTTCFLSAVTCPCSPDKLTCLHHVTELCAKCQPPEFVLRYRYSLDELPPILYKLKQRAEAFDNWCERVNVAFSKTEEKMSLAELKILLSESEKGKFPENDLLHRVKSVVHEADMCSRVAQQLVKTRKHRTRLKDPTSATLTYKGTLTLDEIQAFHKQLQCLPCAVEHLKQVSEYIVRIEEFIKEVEVGLKKEEPSSEEITKLLEDSTEFDLDLPQIPLLHQALQQAKWLENVRQRLLLDDDDDTPKCPVTLEQLRKLIDSGVSVAPRRSVERAMAELQELLTLAEGWEEKAKMCLLHKQPVSLNTAMLVTEKAEQIPVALPQCLKLGDVVKKAQAWVEKVKKVQNQDYYPYLEVLEMLTMQARPMCIQLEQVSALESQINSAKAWKERTTKTFLKKNTIYTLLQVLLPRTEPQSSASLKWRRKKLKNSSAEEQHALEKNAKLDNINWNDPPDPNKVVSNFKSAEMKEVELILQIRQENQAKVSNLPIDINSSPVNHVKCNSQPASPAGEDDQSASDKVLYCVCKKPSSGFMLQCEVCHDWFHSTCVPLPKLSNNKSKVQQLYELKFLCPLCHRSRRPHLTTILTLLLQLQKLPVRIREGEALQCATERAMAWQDRARKVLSSPECQNALEQAIKLTGESETEESKTSRKPRKKRSSESGRGGGEENVVCKIESDRKRRLDAGSVQGRSEARDSIDEAIEAVIQNSKDRAAPQDNPMSEGVNQLLSAASQAERRFSSQSEASERSTEDVMEAAEALAMIAGYPSKPKPPQQQDSQQLDNRLPSDQNRPANAAKLVAFSSGRLNKTAHSLENIKNDGSSVDSQRMRPNTPDLVCREQMTEHFTPNKPAQNDTATTESPRDGGGVCDTQQTGPVVLSDDTKRLLEGLMLEGDLLEVTLAETQTIWKILQASQPIKDENFIDLLEKEEQKYFNPSQDEEGEKKRRKREDSGALDKKRKKQRSTEEKEKKDKTEKRRRKKENKQAIVAAAMAGEDDEYAICSVETGTGGRQRCLQPLGEEVNWVQCDGGCEEWFHCVCVQITALEARDCDYVCEACKNIKSPSTTTTTPSSSLKPPRQARSISRQNSETSNMDVDVIGTAPPSPSP